MKKQLLLMALLALCGSVRGEGLPKEQVWQWACQVPLVSTRGEAYQATVRLWIPPACERVRAVMICSTAVSEQTMAEDPAVRAACARNGIAIAWSARQFDFPTPQTAGIVASYLAQLAETSGYGELAHVPWIPVGHSRTNAFAHHLTRDYHGRVAFSITHKTSPNYGDTGRAPVLITDAEYYEWDSYGVDLRQNITQERTMPKVVARRWAGQLVSFFFDPNTGHFDCSKSLLDAIAAWIDATMPLRVGPQGELLPVDEQAGWVAGLPVPGFEGWQPVAAADARGEERFGAWYPDLRCAQTAWRMADVPMTRRAQVAGFADRDGSYETGWTRAVMIPFPFEWNPDGFSITVNALPYTHMPRGEYPGRFTYEKGSPGEGQFFRFTNRDDTLANSGNPISLESASGDLIQTGARTFDYVPRYHTFNYVIVRQAGDSLFRGSVQPGQFIFTPRTSGRENRIDFGPLPEALPADTLTLRAKASSGLSVRFLVSYGPAHVDSLGRLVIDRAQIPPRAKYPVPIAVTAYQLGSNTPAVRTAESVTRITTVAPRP